MPPPPAQILPVRPEIAAAHGDVLRAISRPGTWWPGDARVQIAAEARAAWSCHLCDQRRKALSPLHVSGEHDFGSALPTAAIDAIHRIVTDPGRLSRRDVEGWLAAGLTEGQYVELVGVASKILCLDFFARAISQPSPPLPHPEAGPPTEVRPARLHDEGAWVPIIDQGKAEGAESDLFVEGYVPRVVRALSLSPDEVRGLKLLMAVHYLEGHRVPNVLQGTRAISRSQMEYLAVRVSAFNECFY